MDLAIVIPTYNERDNIRELVRRLDCALTGLSWEVVFVDDDSPDGTADVVRALARSDRRVRLLHRIGRRGLSSACIEGMLATSAQAIAVMDADLQHDETKLACMLSRLRGDSLDVVIGTRNADGGSMGEFARKRVMISRMGQRVSNMICRSDITDPMSGFFVISRPFFMDVVHRLHGGGFKILLDIVSSSNRPVRFTEVGYTFRLRQHGESKLDVNTAIEYFFLVIDKLTHRRIPARFASFSLVGIVGAITHLLCVWTLMSAFHWRFIAAQIAATYVAMTENFFLNNLITWRDRSLKGWRMASGLASFWVACSFGAWANVIFANALLNQGVRWYFAGAAGILLSSVWNYSMANLFTWSRKGSILAMCSEEDEAAFLDEEALEAER